MEICLAFRKFVVPTTIPTTPNASYHYNAQCRVDVQGNNLSSLWEKQERKILQILKVVLSYTNKISKALPLNASNILVFARHIDFNPTVSMSSHTRQPFLLFQIQC